VKGADGGYAFRTIKPLPYTGRTPHIHVKVIHLDRELTTQFYIADHKLNAGDWLFQSMSRESQRAVSMVFKPGSEGEETSMDIIM